MVLSLILMTFSMMVLLFGFNAAQLNHQTTKLQYTADNTAQSLANMVARDMNFKAYTNRASVANQVAVAQLVGLSAWFNMADVFADNACDALCSIPYVGQVVNAIARAVEYINQGAQPFFEGLVYVENAMLYALSFAQQAVHYAGVVSGPISAREVVTANDPDARLDTAQNIFLGRDVADIWFNFQKRFSRSDIRDGTQYNDYIAVVGKSRDNFTKGMNYRLDRPWTWTLFPLRLTTQKAGGSDLVSNGRNKAESWTSAHTLSFWFQHYNCHGFRCRWRGGEVPLGWGGTRSDDRANMNRINNRQYWGQSRRKNPRATRLAARYQETRGGYDGVQPFFALDRDGDSKSQTRNITVVVSKPRNKVKTTPRLQVGHDNTDPAINEEMLADRMTALASANAYYSRPRDLTAWLRRDRRHEYGNFYNPFWQARLAEPSNRVKSEVLALTKVL
ncbi:hypothetical protein JYB84_14480 [Shewanella cyperi]|nr:hypothetical protein JYB84_14480 [Shewanella cyperi]